MSWKYIKKKWIELHGEINKLILQGGDFNLSLQIIDKLDIPKLSKDTHVEST